MASYWGECFPMGGIGGAPFVGKTGFGAFSAHVPDDGHVFILFGPHVAISESGEIGKHLRIGQTKHSAACGALLDALDACRHGRVRSSCADGLLDLEDMQQSWLKQCILERHDEIEAADEPIQKLCMVAYEVVRDKLLRIVHTNFGSGNLVLLGGIGINMPHPYEDHFHPLLFQVLNRDKDPH
eukprot:CAMPEP_0181231402 /NCGR_PEP_ID=MMETSP1096-20121128/35081_1 /TAXON_ID=156174 ORGANISM="Chrysochromulina ericina, Strain CCMP281" /NCGR_SAMPLE_ID=MMETSP1096 /ASSEMBLY_ACC=CAM_ASM_000453 /LENGTH=182 /DNA_ID=CAMNT_0023325429 /DNA_START=8 /DNA_END=553 /DNA_ORIENTATION=+